MWKYVSYIKKGISHQAEGIDCQDSVTIHEDENCIVAALADGLGSLKYSALASRTATSTVCQWLSSVKQEELILDTKEQEDRFRVEFTAALQDTVLKVAQENSVKSKMLDCTLAFAFVSKVGNFALAGLIGDSAVCIIAEDDSFVISDSGSFSNGTRAVLDKDAGEHMLLRKFKIDRDKVVGFILTSDGLDNEIYIKGSTHVNQVAGDYFNTLLEQDPHQEIDLIISDLTSCEDTPFDDDISLAIISRAKEKIQMETDPSWLCTCGCRNVLQNTYCVNCNQDFTKLYCNVRFRDFGGKAAFFKKINGNTEEERKLIGLPPVKDIEQGASLAVQTEVQSEDGTTEAVQASVPAQMKETEYGSTRHNRKKEKVGNKNTTTILALIAVAVFAVGAIGGMIVGRLSARNKTDDLLNDLLTVRKDLVSKEQQIEELCEQMEQVITDDFCVLDNGAYYWGQMVENVPNGCGILWLDGNYYVGNFVDGLREGVFTVIQNGDSQKIESVTYSQGELQIDVLPQEVQYLVAVERVNVRDNPGTDNTNVIGQRFKGDIVPGTGETCAVGEDEWAEIYWENGETAWILLRNLQTQENTSEQTTPEETIPEDTTSEQETTLGAELYVVLANNLNVRNQPGQEGTEVIGEVRKGDVLTATGMEQTIGQSVWIEIEWEDGTAWVSSKRLEKQQ